MNAYLHFDKYLLNVWIRELQSMCFERVMFLEIVTHAKLLSDGNSISDYTIISFVTQQSLPYQIWTLPWDNFIVTSCTEWEKTCEKIHLSVVYHDIFITPPIHVRFSPIHIYNWLAHATVIWSWKGAVAKAIYKSNKQQVVFLCVTNDPCNKINLQENMTVIIKHIPMRTEFYPLKM